MKTLKGDFISFHYDGISSSTLGIIRTSDGSRYNHYLLPSFKDLTAPMPGGNGTYYWETNFIQRKIMIPIAFDNLTEIEFMNLHRLFGQDGIHSLIFDETPYKEYKVRVESEPELNYICFTEDNKRIYKGEGKLSFNAYYPFAICTKKYLSEYNESNIPDEWKNNINEWSEGSRLLEEQNSYDIYTSVDNKNIIPVTNRGDLPTSYKIYIKFPTTNTILLSKIKLTAGENEILNEMNFNYFNKQNQNDIYLRINSYTHIIDGVDQNKKPTGSIYNLSITSGNLSDIPADSKDYNFEFYGTNLDTIEFTIEYNYLYY